MSVAVEFSTIPEMFQKLTEKFADETRPVLMHKLDGNYVGISYGELRARTEFFACGLASMGLKPGDRVSIISENRPEWVVTDQAVAALGAITVPIYPTMTAKQNEYIFNDAGVRFVVVSNQFQLNKVLRIRENVPTLEGVILMNEKQGGLEPGVTTFSSILAAGKTFGQENPDFVNASRKTIRPEDLLTLIYTSGTTGNPKGVMLTHDNLASNIVAASEVIHFGTDDLLLSFLPLSHSFERMAGYYTAMACGATIAYAESVETVRDNMQEVRPTIVTTVPRLFERIHSRLMKQIDAAPPLRQKIFRWAVGVGRKRAGTLRGGKSPSFVAKIQHGIADKLVYSKLKRATGGRIKFFVSGGAALAREFGEFFEAVGLKIIEGYGLTESSPVIAANETDHYKWGSVGPVIPGVEVKIAGDGEILARGRNIMKGYWNNPEATREAIDSERWLHTGDIGHLDAEGFLYITDRKKHLFVSSGGKNIAPQPIENLFLSSKYIEQFMLIGDRRMYLTALIVPDFDALKEYADSNAIRYSSNVELTSHPAINTLIEDNINQIQRDLANYERVRKFTLLDRQFTVEDGELTPTQKVRRKAIEERYKTLIESMYKGIS
jgi:long-chain acyl-CoA synthetase